MRTRITPNTDTFYAMIKALFCQYYFDEFVIDS